MVFQLYHCQLKRVLQTYGEKIFSTPNLCDSDHFPIILNYSNKIPPIRTHSKWHIAKANWPLLNKLSLIDYDSADSNVFNKLEKFTKKVLKAAELSIPMSKTTIKSSMSPTRGGQKK